MDDPTPQYRCEACGAIHLVQVLSRNKWGDPCCPDCKDPRLKLHRSRMAGILAAYYLFNVV
jgi:hypothetical protein